MSDVQQALENVAEEGFVDVPQVEIWSDEDNKAAFISYIQAELEAVSTDAGRTVKMDRIDTIRRQRVAKTKTETKDFPWKNASNISPPLALEKTNTVTTKLVQNYSEKIPLFQYESTPGFKKNADAITRHIQKENESPYGVGIYDKLWDIIYDCVSLGTRFVKVPFTQNYMSFTRLGEDGGNQKVHQLIKSSPDIIPIPFEDFMTRPEWSNIQKAPWVAVRYFKHTHELKRLAQQGYYSNVDLVISKSGSYDEHKEAEMLIAGIEPSGVQAPENNIYEIYEVNCFWDADGDGFDEDIIVHIEKESGTVLRAEYNDLGIRDYVRIPYIDIPNNLYGVGVGDIMMSLQEEAEALHNMRNDGTQLAMLPFVVSSTQSDMGKSMNLYPGKWVKTPVPREDIQIHKFPDIGASAMQAESIVQDYANKATGAAESLGGRDVGGSNRIGATGTQFLASQSTGFLSSIALQMGNKFSEIGMLILYRMVKHSGALNLDSLSEADQQLVSQVYGLNVEDIPASFKFKTRLSSLQDSKATKQQESTQLMGLYSAYGDKMIELSAQMSNPQLAEAPKVLESIQSYMVGFTNIMEKVLINYDESNVGDYLPFIDDMKMALNLQDGLRKQEVENAQSTIAGAGGADSTGGLGADAGGGGVPNLGEGEGAVTGSGGTQAGQQPESIGGEPI